MRKLLAIGLMAIALIGCGDKVVMQSAEEYDAAAKQLQDMDTLLSTVGMNQIEYRQRLGDIAIAIQEVPENQQSALLDVYRYHDAALDIWSCDISQDCRALMDGIDAQFDDIDIARVTKDAAVQDLWAIASVKTAELDSDSR